MTLDTSASRDATEAVSVKHPFKNVLPKDSAEP